VRKFIEVGAAERLEAICGRKDKIVKIRNI